MITEGIQKYIDASVLCWLATVSEDGFPSVSPKEAFLHNGEGRIVIANVASPKSVANIQANERACVSFIDVFVQKGFRITGKAAILNESDKRYSEQRVKLAALIGPDHTIISVIEVLPLAVEPIIAPSYTLISGRTKDEQIAQALDTYKVRKFLAEQRQSKAGSLSGRTEFSGQRQADMIESLDHIQLAMPPGEEEKARSFFRDVLGMVEDEKPAPLAGRGGCWFRSGAVVVHVGVEKDFLPQKKAHPAFCVADLAALGNRLAERGFSVTWDDALPDRRRFYSADPFGNRIEFIQCGDGFGER